MAMGCECSYKLQQITKSSNVSFFIVTRNSFLTSSFLYQFVKEFTRFQFIKIVERKTKEKEPIP